MDPVGNLHLPVRAPDIVLKAGDDDAIEWSLRSGGELVDFTGWDFVCQWREWPDADDFVPVPVAVPSTGVLRLIFDSALSRRLKASGVLDVEGRTAEGKTKTFVEANVSVKPDVTRRVL